ncbi:hypothetical protein FC79_GL000352 [Lentilactobacillus buchneri DSM 20057]|nr:hypothetical protein FC79_GL000352 [Lentilactobacillus buchneri DSM 20057]
MRIGAVNNRSLSWLWGKLVLISPKAGLGAGCCPEEHVSAWLPNRFQQVKPQIK